MSVGLRLRALCVVATATFAASAGIASAAGWSAPVVLEPAFGKNPLNGETAPRVAVNARGQSVVAWIDAKGRVGAAGGDAHGHFTRIVTFETGGLRPAVTISADGTAVIVWSHSGRLRYVRRVAGHRFSSPAVLVPRSSKLSNDFARAAIQPDGSTLVVYEAASRTPTAGYVTQLRSVRIAPGGHPGKWTAIGPGSVRRDAFGLAADGHVAVCCLATPAPLGAPAQLSAVAGYTPTAGWATLAAQIGPKQVIETVAAGRGDVALGTVDVSHSGDVGLSGQPGLLRADARGVFGAPLAAPVTNPGRAFGPVVAIDGSGRNVLVYQEKAAPKAFSRLAPISAVTGPRSGAFGARQILDRRPAYFPQMTAYRTGAIVVWEAPRHRWGVAIERDGRFVAAPTPAGGPSNVGEDFIRSRDLAAGGRYAALTWTASDGSVRVSVGAL